jgi:DNA ligase (NAD+)
MHASQFIKILKTLHPQDICDVHGIGEVLVSNLTEFLQSTRCDHLIAKLEFLETKNLGINIQSSKAKKVEGVLSGEVICITGTFDISRPQIKEKLEVLGAKVVDNVTTKTTILLAGEEAGSKLAKAKKAGINIVENLEELLG